MTFQTGSVLDLPEDQQRQIAAHMGMSLEAWRKDVAEWRAKVGEFIAKMDAEEAKRPSPTPEDIEAARRFQARVDSEASVPVRVVWKPRTRGGE